MGTKPAPHAGMGVAQYAWATSPLRRYVDLVNQWQIIACARHGRTAALAAPFKPKDVAAVLDHLRLRRGLCRVQRLPGAASSATGRCATWSRTTSPSSTPTVMKDGLVRADTLPLVFRAVGAEQPAARRARARARRRHRPADARRARARVLARLDDAPARADADAAAEDDDADSAGPLAHRDRRRRAEDADAEADPRRRPPPA